MRRTRVRRARPEDAPAIGRIYVETWQATYAGLLPEKMLAAMSEVRQSAWWSRALADPDDARGIFVVDHAEADVVGFGSCGPVRELPAGLDGTERRVGEIYTLYVEPDFQDQGYGRSLLDAMFKQLRGAGSDAVVLWMLADNPSRFFYEAMGGAPVGHRLDRMAGTEVEEVAYAWHDLDAPLIRRRLAPEEEG
jgi:ribosomal protein S18 acetylase RimI-like enzyme